MPDDKLRYVVYARQSLSRHEEDSLSIEMQVKACREFVAAQGGILSGVYEEPNTRGWRTDRPEFAKMLDALRNGRADRVVVFKLSRFARNLIHQETVLNDIAAAGGELVSVTEPFLNGSPMVRQILGAVNEQAKRDQSDFLRASFAARAKRGKHHGYAPLGYAQTDDDELVIDEATAETVREMFSLALLGYGAPLIGDRLDAAGMPSPTGRRWSGNGIHRTLRNPVYVGDVQHRGEVVARDAHPPIIDRDRFDRVQRILDARGHTRRKESSSWAEGFVDHVCGQRMHLTRWYRKRGDPPRPRFRCYRATRREPGRCTTHRQSVFQHEVEDVFLDLLIDALSDVLTPQQAAQRIEAQRDGSKAERERQRQRLARRIDDVQRQRDRLLDLTLAGRVDDEMYVVRDVALKDELARLRAEVDAVPDDVPESALQGRHATIARIADALPIVAHSAPERLTGMLHELDVRLVLAPDDAWLRFGEATAPFVRSR